MPTLKNASPPKHLSPPTSASFSHSKMQNATKTNPYDSYVSTNGNQVLFMNAKRAQVNDSVMKTVDTAPPGAAPKGSSFQFGHGAEGMIVDNTVVAAYTGNGTGVDITKFLLDTPLLPRAVAATARGAGQSSDPTSQSLSHGAAYQRESSSPDTTTPGAGTPGGGIKIGNGSTDLIFENCVFRTYTGSDQALNVQAFLTQPPVLPRRSVREQAECAHKTVSGLPRDY
ncbi:unnamed protein product [Cyclocybe aegerita]|uniref:Uncharacterized protein n=1 Tax=Cyclocybe aegerita TaxID=1973307 RepID=A0A8S0WJ33_CYCAE|nr:unnamed protein product [Cyclocybe aegerita]